MKFFLGALLWMLSGIHSLKAQPPVISTTPEQNHDLFEWVTITFQEVLHSDSAIHNVQKAIEGRTSLKLNPVRKRVQFSLENLRKYPFLHLEMCREPPVLKLAEKFAWRDFFNSGGTLFLDACSGSNPVISQWKQWGEQIFANSGWVPLNSSHTLSFSFYLLEKKMRYARGGNPVSVLENDGRFIIILNQSTAWNWNSFVASEVSPLLNEFPLELHLRFYVNLLMYLQTGNYKSDQLHLPTILLRRR
ncbi:MAG: DUF4159 domain-containing protein [SAR324 cluster bacterium]|nr:DUF4159 domain-containing protein [SAR324 cluster bacterium]MBF0351862.1 DUF4159 domain-containing protein [SAR324 cluster bacterium]